MADGRVKTAAQRRRDAYLKWRGRECQTLQTCSPGDREWALSILRKFDIPWLEAPPAEWRGGYVAVVFFLPWRDRPQFAYIFKKKLNRLLLDYRGSGTRLIFCQALNEVAPNDCLLIPLYFGLHHAAYEEHYQELGGIPYTVPEIFTHPVWLNGTIGDQNSLTKDQRRANILRLHSTPEFAKATAERMRLRHADPEFARALAERHAALFLARRSSPQFQARLAERLSRNPDTRFNSAMQLVSSKDVWHVIDSDYFLPEHVPAVEAAIDKLFDADMQIVVRERMNRRLRKRGLSPCAAPARVAG